MEQWADSHLNVYKEYDLAFNNILNTVESQHDPRELLRGQIKQNLENATSKTQSASLEIGEHPMNKWINDKYNK